MNLQNARQSIADDVPVDGKGARRRGSPATPRDDEYGNGCDRMLVSLDPNAGAWLPDDTEDDWRRWWGLPPERRALAHLGHVMENIRDLPQLAADDGIEIRTGNRFLSTTALIACRESFLTNVRIVADFFVKFPPRDFHARVYLPRWTAPRELRWRLERHALTASQHIVHLSRRREPETLESFVQADLSLQALMQTSYDCFDTLVAFTRDYDAADGIYAGVFRDTVVGTRPRGRDRGGAPSEHDL